jgi:phosphoglycerate dehydrogenase-like enzyme
VTTPERGSGTIVHQFPEELAAIYRARLPAGIKFEALPADDPWTIPDGAEILLVNASGPASVDRSTPRPKGWPNGLVWAQLRSTGIDGFPDWLFDLPIVTVSRGGQATAISEYVLAAMLSHEKRMPQIWTNSRDDWRTHNLGSLAGKTLGLVGFGHIGEAVAHRALAFEMKVMASRRSREPSGFPGIRIASLDSVLSAADHLVICAPLTHATRGLIDEEAFARMKPSTHFVNIGRGAIVDTEALRVALDSGQIAAATLDVTHPEPPPAEHWLYSHPNVRLSPHVSYSAPETDARVTDIFFANLECYLSGDFPGLHGVASRIEGY